MDCTLFGTRIIALFFTVLYFFPGPANGDAYYYKALLAGWVMVHLNGFSLSRSFVG